MTAWKLGTSAIALALLTLVDTNAAAEQVVKLKLGKNQIEAVGEHKTPVVAIVTLAPGHVGADARREYWGVDWERGIAPEMIVSRVQIIVGRDSVYIPWHAYNDLGEANSMRLVSGTCTALSIQGGDASTSYHADFQVLHGMLYKRSVRSGEFPTDLWEETVYSWIQDVGQ